MKIEDVHSVYFVGIGGIGMSAIARWFNERGVAVGGYDRVKTPLTQRLETEGMWVHYTDNLEEVPENFKSPETLIVFTPAIPKSHSELNFFQEGEFTVMKRSEVLGLISRGHYTVAVGGTHGKTTTSSMVSHLLHHSSTGCSAFVGGIMTNYDSNLIVGSESAPVVVEADEFDRSFHRLSPDYAIISSVDPDHLDIYGNETEMKRAFGQFIDLTDPQGKTLIHHTAAEKIASFINTRFYTYGIEEGDVQARSIHAVDGTFVFDYYGDQVIKDIQLEVPGFHNVENAIAAITVALDQGMDADLVKDTIASYRGVKRRFEYIIKDERFIYIDDYAHHPTEITSFLKSVKELFPTRKLTAVFQPHLFTRTRDFQEGFAESLDLADEVILLDIYPAREEPIPGITSEVILNKMKNPAKTLCSKEELLGVLDKRNVELLCTVGAGDIDQLVPQLKTKYIKELSLEA